MAGFNLTFQKWFVSFTNENNYKTDLQCCSYGSETKKNFHSRSPITTLKGTFLNFLSYLKISDWHLVPGDFYKKQIPQFL